MQGDIGTYLLYNVGANNQNKDEIPMNKMEVKQYLYNRELSKTQVFQPIYWKYEDTRQNIRKTHRQGKSLRNQKIRQNDSKRKYKLW